MSSAKPGRKSAYSADIRWLIIILAKKYCLENTSVYLREIALAIDGGIAINDMPSNTQAWEEIASGAKQRFITSRGKYMSEVQLFRRDVFVFV